MFCLQPHTGSHGTSSLKVTDFLYRRNKKKKNIPAPIENRLPAPRMFSSPKKKRKKRKDQQKNGMTSHSFSYCEHCSQRFFFSAVAAREAALRISTIKVTAFLQQQNKKMRFSKRSSCAEKVLFSKKKKKKKENETGRPRPHIPSHIASATACAFICRCSVRRARSCPSGRFSFLPRFSLQLQDFAAVSMETARLRVQKAKSCSRVTRALSSPSLWSPVPRFFGVWWDIFLQPCLFPFKMRRPLLLHLCKSQHQKVWIGRRFGQSALPSGVGIC